VSVSSKHLRDLVGTLLAFGAAVGRVDADISTALRELLGGKLARGLGMTPLGFEVALKRAGVDVTTVLLAVIERELRRRSSITLLDLGVAVVRADANILRATLERKLVPGPSMALLAFGVVVEGGSMDPLAMPGASRSTGWILGETGPRASSRSLKSSSDVSSSVVE
jgi:hypothetical protein